MSTCMHTIHEGYALVGHQQFGLRIRLCRAIESNKVSTHRVKMKGRLPVTVGSTRWLTATSCTRTVMIQAGPELSKGLLRHPTVPWWDIGVRTCRP